MAQAKLLNQPDTDKQEPVNLWKIQDFNKTSKNKQQVHNNDAGDKHGL